MKRPFFYIFAFLLLAFAANAQKITPADVKILQKKEDSLKALARTLIMDSLAHNRMRSDSQFVRTLLRSIHVRNSFYYPYDSVRGIGNVYSPDSLFRIITWSITYTEDFCQQRGVIQFRTVDGSAKYVPLLDYSTRTPYPEDSVRNNRNWIGAIYYNIIKTKHNNRNYYTLFGYDPNSVRSNKKWIEVLTFNENQMPVFGGRYFSFEKDSVKRADQFRYVIEYKKQASTTMNYDPELQMILVDHLISESDEPELAHTLVPDGDYEGFKWVNGKWLHVDKVFNEKIDMKGVDPYMGNPPVGDPLIDKSGNRDDKKLEEKSNTNKSRKKDNN